MVNQLVSLKSNFHTTEDLLIERARLHGLVDFFWQHLPYTRDDVYQRISTILHTEDAHISDLNTEQIKQIAQRFQEYLADLAPCMSCKHGHQTPYGVYMCNNPDMHGAYWLNTANAVPERCKLYVPGHIPVEK